MNRVKGIILSGLLLCLGAFSGCRVSEPKIITEAVSSESGDTADLEKVTKAEEESLENSGSVKIYVDVSGAVATPGVYELAADSRVYDAVQKAGGLLESADSNSLNQAERLSDGQKIRIFTIEETKELALNPLTSTGGSESAKDTSVVNLNQADASVLMTLPGIGEAKAADIIAYRTEHGGFKEIEEIKNISGIKDAVFDKIKDKIAVK